jgi:hypothetical protein
MTRTHFEQYEYTTAYNRLVKSFVQAKHTLRMAVHHAEYRNGWWAVNFQRHRVMDSEVVGGSSEEFSAAELRHFYLGDLQHALYEKVCGLNDERIYYRDIRTGMIKHGLTEGSAKKETEFLLPLIHDEFKALIVEILE